MKCIEPGKPAKIASKPSGPRSWKLLSSVVPPIVVFVSVNLCLTFVSFAVSDVSARTGILRPQNSILPKIGELAGVGMALGVASRITRKAFDLVLAMLSAAFVLLLDLDHLPSIIGLSQPIRPAHSLGFLMLGVVAFLPFIRNAPELEFVFASSFFGHMAADTGLFGIFEPLSFTYANLQDYRLLFASLAVLFALIAGRVRYERVNKRHAFTSGGVGVS